MSWNRVEYICGQLLGNSTYLYDVDSNIGRRQAMFKCYCGNEFVAQVYKVKILETKSCGCFHKQRTSESNTIHGLRNHKLYEVWKSMKARCTNQNTKQYKDYGGNGVIICKEWARSFIVFYEWAMSNGWKDGLQLDKDIKGTGFIYSPENCLFVSPKENSNKRKTNKYIEYNGVTKTISEWADFFGISLKNLYQRLSRGWSIEKCFSK